VGILQVYAQDPTCEGETIHNYFMIAGRFDISDPVHGFGFSDLYGFID
jgi:hypothetical protein